MHFFDHSFGVRLWTSHSPASMSAGSGDVSACRGDISTCRHANMCFPMCMHKGDKDIVCLFVIRTTMAQSGDMGTWMHAL